MTTATERKRAQRRENRLCERCGVNPDAWFTDAGYLCNACTSEWTAWRFARDQMLDALAPLADGQRRGWRYDR